MFNPRLLAERELTPIPLYRTITYLYTVRSTVEARQLSRRNHGRRYWHSQYKALGIIPAFHSYSYLSRPAGSPVPALSEMTTDPLSAVFLRHRLLISVRTSEKAFYFFLPVVDSN